MKSKRLCKGEKFWQKHIQLWEASNLSQSEYCRQNNFATSTFNKWCQKLLKEPASVNLVPVSVPVSGNCSSSRMSSGIYFTFGRYRLEINRDFDEGTFINILRCLETL